MLSAEAEPQPSASADNTYLALDNTGYHDKPHPIIVYNYTIHLRAVHVMKLSTQLD